MVGVCGRDTLRALNGIEAFYDDLTPSDLLSEESRFQALSIRALQIHSAGLSLRKLTNMGKLPRKIQRAWKSARNLFKPSFDSALATFESTNDELILLNAELALYALPAHVLLHLTGNKLHPYSTSLDLDDGTSIPCQAWRAAKNHSIPSPAADPNDVSLSQQGHQAAIHAARKAMYRGKP